MPGDKRIHHPLLGDVDVEHGPTVLDEDPRFVLPGREDIDEATVIELPAPEPVPEPPGVRRLAKRLLVAGLRRLVDTLDKE